MGKTRRNELIDEAPYIQEQDYYEDEGEFLYDEEELELRGRLRNKLAAVFGTSYGISITAHVVLLAVLATIAIAGPTAPQAARIEIGVKPVTPERVLPPELPSELKDVPPVDLPDIVPEPVEELVEPEPVPQEAFGEPDNITNKNLQDISNQDTFGLSGTPAGAKGRSDRLGRCKDFGGNPGSIDGVKRALRWLAAHQSPDGRWDSDGWSANCSRGPTCAGPGTNTGMGGVDTGITSMAVLAFMGHGYTHQFGRFKRVVRKAKSWLVGQQQKDGSIGYHEAGEHGGMYCHAISTMALCELYGLSGDRSLRRPAQRAVDFILEAQNPNLAWRYRPRSGRNDTSVTGWMVLALKAANTARLNVPKESFAGALNWLKRMTTTNGDVGYMDPGSGSSGLKGSMDEFDPVPTLPGVSVVCRIFSGEKKSTEGIRRGSRILDQNLPVWEERKLNFYYWYYGTYAQFQIGGVKWDRWNQAMLKALLPNQRTGACEDGSWDPQGEWCSGGGRVYATAINALTLEIYYRYERMQTK